MRSTRTAGGGKPVAILGGGFAGLVAARACARRGVPYVVIEAAPSVGGLAASRSVNAGVPLDIGAHFITNRLAHQLGMGQLVRRLARYEEAVFLDGRWIPFPFGIVRIPGAGRSLLDAWRRGDGGRHEQAAGDIVRRQYGEVMASRVVVPLLERWSGVDASQLAASAVTRLPTSFVTSAALHAWRLITGRPIALGYCRERPVHAGVWMVYPRTGGIGALSAALARELDGPIHLGTAVRSLEAEGGVVRSVTTDDSQIDVRSVVSTVPAPLLPRLVRGIGGLERLEELQFRRLVVVNVVLAGRKLLPATVGWFPETDYPFLRITEVPQSAPWVVPEGQTMLTVDFSVGAESTWWLGSDDEVAEGCVRCLAAVVGGVESRVLGLAVTRVALGYPIFHRAYEEVRVSMPGRLREAGIVAVGRNGEFDHLLMEDVYWRTEAAVGEMLARG